MPYFISDQTDCPEWAVVKDELQKQIDGQLAAQKKAAKKEVKEEEENTR